VIRALDRAVLCACVWLLDRNWRVGDVDLVVRLGRRPRSLPGGVAGLLDFLRGRARGSVDPVVVDAGVDPGSAKTIVDEALPVYEELQGG